ncbi:MAG: hypothetical protein ABSB71_04965 [Candidatus Bathyarchaeia archaeon]
MNWSAIEGKPREVKVKGKIHAIFDYVPTNSPLSDYYEVTLYPTKGKIYRLKFKKKEDLERQAFTVDETVIVEGRLRIVDSQQILTNVKRSSEEF